MEFLCSKQGDEMRHLDERVIGAMMEVRDHPVIKDTSTSLHLAISHMVEAIVEWMREKTEKSTKVHEGYVIWKARALNNTHAIMDFARRKAAADSKWNNKWSNEIGNNLCERERG
jgi:hypothetical protein